MTPSRRELFRWLRPAGRAVGEPPEPAPEPAPEAAPLAPAAASPREPVADFSLDGFYRARSTPAPLPSFPVHAAAATATTAVGQGPGRSAPPAPSLANVAPVPAGLVPEVIDAACLAVRSFCSVCVERCPQPGAIVVTAGRPRVVEDRCDGCGRCVAVCPAPILALALVARRAPRGAP